MNEDALSHIAAFNNELDSTPSLATPNPTATPLQRLNSARRRPLQWTASKKVNFHSDLPSDQDSELFPQTLQEVCNRSWQVSRVSPMANAADEARRQLAAKHMGDRIAKCLEIDPNEVMVTFEVAEGLRGTRHDDDNLRLVIESRRSERAKSVIYRAFLISVDSSDHLISEPQLSFTLLPLMLHSCTNSEVEEAVHLVLEYDLGCHIFGPRRFSQEEMKWMAAMWIELRKEGDKNNEEEALIKLHYELEQKVKGIDHFLLQLPKNEAFKLWRRFHDAREQHATEIEMKDFHSALNKNVRDYLSVDLDHLLLTNVDFPTVKIQQRGTVRVSAQEHVKTVLRFLTEICNLGLSSTTPSIIHGININSS